MTRDQAVAVLWRALHEVAPEADLAAVDPDGLLQDEVGLDSIDFLRVVDIVGAAAGADIPERDFPSLSTFRAFVSYLAAT
ncbi:MAG TPA: acyl carrier protein [Acidimicrobiales bacterium]|nr:acyl carrier protein [Acidimicrobiales bacterium]